jgi:acyl transferase domain-containing protein
MPVDTACSSSLVAIHLACESLKKRECRVAIAGGVNLYLHPAKYHSFCQRHMLARDGRCRSFGAGDDGFVPAEGVGALLLKPLSQALEDHDHIYAVVAGSGFEHAGRSNGYSAPNPNSQASLIGRALSKANIDPESIGYVEGHGTGTQLGDSLEVAALTQVFRKHTAKKQFCSLGSIKGNLGHSESAAGISAVTKVLLQLKHQRLVPTLHSQTPNPDIDFEASPFYLQHAASPWSSSPLHPRRALINSFGAGGVNACVILEEHAETAVPVEPPAGRHLFVLSARTEERLQEYANRVLSHLRRQASIDLADLSYTLQVGRESMSQRVAIVAADADELVGKLSSCCERRGVSGVYRGSPDPGRSSRKASARNAHGMQSMLAAGDLDKLALAWVSGEEVAWQRLHSSSQPRRISLPTYPLAGERYSISKRPTATRHVPESPRHARLHPLISHNSSTLNEVSFSSLLSAREFYAQDHRVRGQMVFPGSGFLEIACISAAMAGARRVRRLRDVLWSQPLVFRQECESLRIALKSVEDGAEYIITSFDADRETVVHSEGMVYFGGDATEFPQAQATIDIERLKEHCSKRLDCDRYYELFDAAGLQYGPAFRTLRELYVGKSQALSRIEIAAPLRAEFSEFILHPCILDGALQTVSTLIGDVACDTPHLPFAIGDVEIIGSLSETCYVQVEPAALEGGVIPGVKKFHIRIASQTGRVLVDIRDFCVRALEHLREDARQTG